MRGLKEGIGIAHCLAATSRHRMDVGDLGLHSQPVHVAGEACRVVSIDSWLLPVARLSRRANGLLSRYTLARERLK